MIFVVIIKYNAFHVIIEKVMYCIDLCFCLILFGKKWRQCKIVRSLDSGYHGGHNIAYS
jgi:hypothetical protein